MNKIFYIADLHFFHERIIPICNRPFKDIEEMHNKLIENWNKKVDNNDIVYVLGDFSFKGGKDKVINILKQLNGRKILLKGNHDKYAGQRDFDECFELVKDIHQVNDNNRQVIVSHYPIIDYAGMYYGAYMVYGHIHDKYVPHKNMFCASVENINYEPVTLDELIEIYKNKEVKEEINWTLNFDI